MGSHPDFVGEQHDTDIYIPFDFSEQMADKQFDSNLEKQSIY